MANICPNFVFICLPEILLKQPKFWFVVTLLIFIFPEILLKQPKFWFVVTLLIFIFPFLFHQMAETENIFDSIQRFDQSFEKRYMYLYVYFYT